MVSNRAIAGKLALVLAGFAAGCDDAASPVHVVDVDDGTYLRGVQVSKLAIDPGHEVVRSELYLDGLRVAADDLAPFELAWDTRNFGDGAHTLVARVYLAGETGRYLDGETAMWIDNTAPQLGALAPAAMRGTSFTIPATDNLKLARVEISRGVEGEAPVVITSDPFTFSWPWACGTTAIHVRAFDAAGGEVATDASVLSADPDDRDCDGYRALASGGNDCDDDSFSAHPGASEVPEGYDLNCDGQVAALPGVDFDGDGVPSIADGGNDCDDRDPAIHGPNYAFAHSAITRDGVPVTWSPDEAVIDGYGSSWQLYLNRGGVVEQYLPGFGDGVPHRTQLATGANAGSIAEYAGQLVAFGSGSQIVILKRSNDSWVPEASFSAAGVVGKLAIASQYTGGYAIAFQIGAEIWLAVWSGTSWSSERVTTVGDSIQEITSVSASSGSAAIELRTSRSGLSYFRNTPTGSFTKLEVSRDVLSVYLYQSQNHAARVDARSDGTGSALYNADSSLLLLRTAQRIEALVQLDARSVLVKYRDNQAPPQVVMFDLNATKALVVEDLPAMADLVLSTSSYERPSVFAGQGVIHYLASTIAAAMDAPDDGVDRDCDKLD